MQFEKYMWIIEEAKSSAQADFKIRIKFSNCIIGGGGDKSRPTFHAEGWRCVHLYQNCR
jgi:hypothetical protein